jgi:hypothetical protein
MKSEDIEIAVARFYGVRANLIVPNASWGAGVHECDLLICSNANYLTEIEIKVSKGDIKKDLKKRHQHRSEKIRRLYYSSRRLKLVKNPNPIVRVQTPAPAKIKAALEKAKRLEQAYNQHIPIQGR